MCAAVVSAVERNVFTPGRLYDKGICCIHLQRSGSLYRTSDYEDKRGSACFLKLKRKLLDNHLFDVLA